MDEVSTVYTKEGSGWVADSSTIEDNTNVDRSWENWGLKKVISGFFLRLVGIS